MLTPLTILVSFTDSALIFMEQGGKPVSISYHDHPEVFGHPRFLMNDFEKSAALARGAIRQMAEGRLALIAPKIEVSFDRPVLGGITEMDKRMIQEILTNAGARKVIWKNA